MRAFPPRSTTVTLRAREPPQLLLRVARPARAYRAESRRRRLARVEQRRQRHARAQHQTVLGGGHLGQLRRASADDDGYFMFLNLTSTPTSVLPHTSLASGVERF